MLLQLAILIMFNQASVSAPLSMSLTIWIRVLAD